MGVNGDCTTTSERLFIGFEALEQFTVAFTVINATYPQKQHFTSSEKRAWSIEPHWKIGFHLHMYDKLLF